MNSTLLKNIVATVALTIFAQFSANAITTPTYITYNWTGICTDCITDPARVDSDASATLVLTDYTPGQLVSLSQIFSFEYFSKIYTTGVGFLEATGGSLGTLPAPPGGSVDFDLVFFGSPNGTDEVTIEFKTKVDGNWSLLESSVVNDEGYRSNYSVSGTVPEPATLALLGLGLIGLGFSRRKKG